MRTLLILNDLQQLVSQLREALTSQFDSEDALLERKDDRKRRAKHAASRRRAETLEAKLDQLSELILSREATTWAHIFAIAVVANQSAERDEAGRFVGDRALGALLDAVLAMGRPVRDGSDVLIFDVRRKLADRE